jgi:hypothetical protein
MPSPKRPRDLFHGIKPVKHERHKRHVPAKLAVPSIVAEGEKTVTIALTMPRSLFESYNKRGSFRDAMVRQLARKFD